MLGAQILGVEMATAESIAMGFGNENWRVTAADGRSYILKLGPVESFDKWQAARRAGELAAAAGVPMPGLVHLELQREYVVRVYDWIDGRSPVDIADQRDCVTNMFATLGSTIAALHSVELDAFSSRLDRTAPSFRRWSQYVHHRVQQIRERSTAHDALDRRTLDQACALITQLANEVSDSVRPTLCHRDLYADNLLVDERGALVAILDWDMAEAWDAAGEWFKLGLLLFPAFPEGDAAFTAAYRAVHPEPPDWTLRTQLVDLMETLNAVANVATQRWNADFESRLRAHLQALLSST